MPSSGCQSAISHVIPLRLVQILNSCRWNCNVFGWSRKMTEGNYVRNLSGPGLPPSGAVAWPAGDTTPIRPARPLACLQSLSKRLHYGCPKMSHVIPLRLVQVLNSCRWNCNVFGACRKMTALNYVRNLAGGGVVTARGHCSLALRSLRSGGGACSGIGSSVLDRNGASG